MTTKAEFNAEEWSKVTQAPALAALRVIAADRGGTIRESLSLGRAYTEARRRGGGGLLDEVVSSAPQLDPSEVGSREQLGEHTNQALREAIQLMESTATPEEVQDYRRFILDVADTVAHAHKEGGFLGIGGKQVSESEQAVLDELARTLGGTSP